MKTFWSRRDIDTTATPSLAWGAMPVLSAGRHRTPRSGACFMEFASFLAGERWSDHPACTHPALAHLARAVNDLTTDQGRGVLAEHIPSVIGVTSDDPRLELVLAVRAAAAALPGASLDRQHALAVGGLVCQESLDRRRGDDAVTPIAREAIARFDAALLDAPEAAGWARRFLERNARWRRTEVTQRQTHATIAMAVDGVRSACLPYPDARLAELLIESIALARRFVAVARSAPAGSAEATPATAASVTAPPTTARAAEPVGPVTIRHLERL